VNGDESAVQVTSGGVAAPIEPRSRSRRTARWVRDALDRGAQTLAVKAALQRTVRREAPRQTCRRRLSMAGGEHRRVRSRCFDDDDGTGMLAPDRLERREARLASLGREYCHCP